MQPRAKTDIRHGSRKVEPVQIIGCNPEMLRIFEFIDRIASGDGSVLITGESGAGKELIARCIHEKSHRNGRPLIPINCCALPETLFESELFGHEKGSFTGAIQTQPGLVELADGGTLFMDEICEMSKPLQAKMLRMLEERSIRRVGGKHEIKVDVRIVTATNRTIEEMKDIALLRQDLFYRINTIHIHVPPLRSRREDIPLLVRHFLNQLERKYHKNLGEIEPEALDALTGYSWPGNVRELQNVVERTYYLANPPGIQRLDLPAYISRAPEPEPKTSWDGLSYREAKEHAIGVFEQDYLASKLCQCDWNISRTADVCGIDRRTIHRLISRYGLKR